MVLEKKLNIQAGNGYFGRKKEKYKESKIARVLEVANYKSDDWVKEDIEEQETIFKKTLLNFFKKNLSIRS